METNRTTEAKATQTKTPGEQLRGKRLKLGLTTRDVDRYSRKIAEERNNEDYVVSHARLVQIENGESTPSVYKLYSLSIIYSSAIAELISYFVDITDALQQHLSLQHEATHLLDVSPSLMKGKMPFPVRFDPGLSPQSTNLVSRMVELWGEVPVGVLQGLDLRRGRWGYIGMNDFTMFPLLRPGSLVQIDDVTKPVLSAPHRTEYDRPIYFVEHRDGYFCSWCEFHKGRIVSVPHPLSGLNSREFAYPNDSSLIGRVTAVAARLVNPPATTKGNVVKPSLAQASGVPSPGSGTRDTYEETGPVQFNDQSG